MHYSLAVGCFSLLTELIVVLPGALATHMDHLIPGIQFSLGSSQNNSNMKIDTLSFIQVSCILVLLCFTITARFQCLLSSHHPTVFHPHAAILVPAIIAAVSDTFYKISSEALVVLQLLVKVDSAHSAVHLFLYFNQGAAAAGQFTDQV